MTIRQAIDQTDALKFNTYSNEDKVQWLSQLDWDVVRNVMETHEGGGQFGFFGYDRNTDPETVLLVPEPFDQMYLRYLESQIDYHNGEMERYNISAMLFNNQYEAYAKWYRRNNMPVSCGRFQF